MKILLLIILFMYTPNKNAEARSSKGEKIYKQKCASCHGAAGVGVKGYAPKLASQFADYLNNQMIDMKNGDRDNGKSFFMVPILKEMSDVEIKQVSEYLESLK